jgi:hypothetical protein
VRSTKPPRLATWLLARLASGKTRESLVGDLIEQYRNGRSASWYWRQALIVVVVLAAMVQLATQVRLVGWTIRPAVQYPQTVLLFFVLVPINILLGSFLAPGPRSIPIR